MTDYKKLCEQIRELIPDGYGHNSDYAKTLERAAEAIERLSGELEDARRTAEYWKAEHLAGNEELAALKAQGKPVAWRYESANGVYRYCGWKEGFDKDYAILKPIALYPHPPEDAKDAARLDRMIELFDRHLIPLSLHELRMQVERIKAGKAPAIRRSAAIDNA